MSFDFVENFTLQLPDFSSLESEISESFNSKHGLIIEVAAIHEGLTANYNNYSSDELEKALESWVEPYPKPIILNHDLNTEPIGRVIAAKMDKEADGSSYVRLQVAITDPVAAQKVLDKRYLTGSVGGRAGKALCSISGEDLAQETDTGRPRLPKYKRGNVYKGKLAYIDMQDISFKEYSFVNQPADQKSGVRSTLSADGKAEVAASDGWVAKSSAFVLHMDTEDIFSLEENKSMLEGMRKKDSKTTYLQTKGAFLSALAIHESESDNSSNESLLSSEDSGIERSEENSIMDGNTKEEDILAVTNGLSEDLSNIASSNDSEEAEEPTAEQAESENSQEEENDSQNTEEEAAEDANEASEEKVSDDDPEEADVQVVDSENAGEPEESLAEDADEVQEESKEESLTAENSSDEQNSEDLAAINALLEQEIVRLKAENSKLKGALHTTLAERVVDTKISLGLAEQSHRDEMIESHISRTASSLADNLRDLASLPAKLGKRTASFLTGNESAFEIDDNIINEDAGELVVNVDEENEVTHENEEIKFEQLFVDALMGRRKL